MQIPIINREFRPRTALNRWGQIIKDVSNPEIPYARKSPTDYYGNADRSFAYLASQPGIGNALEYAVDNPGMVAGGLAAGTLVNNLVGNPVGGTVDFLSMGLTNLKPDEYQALSPQEVRFVNSFEPYPEVPPHLRHRLEPQPSVQRLQTNPVTMQPGMPNQVQIPELNEEERAKFMKYTTNRTAQQVLTYQALQDFLGQQPGMEGYQ